jgi:crotonobetainyl-CoA:carnitine CoA-transferase CaiB-like acyl-CoA transferase
MRSPGMGPLFLQSNRNKRAIVLDLKSPAGIEKLRELIAGSDVLVSNIRPQALARLGLDYANAAKINPSIIYCAAVGYGQGGPYAGEAVYDDLMQAASGISGMFHRVDGKPRYAPVNICDRVVGLYTVIAIQAALYHRHLTGEGQEVEVPMFETMADFVLSDHIGGRAFAPVIGDTGYLRLLSRTRGPYATSDGYIAVVVYTDLHWRKFSAMIGRPNLIDEDERLRDMQARTTHAEVAGQTLADELARKSTGEWLAEFHARDIPVCRVNSVEDLFEDRHLRAVGFFREMEHPTEGAVTVPRPPLNFSRTPLEIRMLAPRLGEHNEEFGLAPRP